VSGLSDYHIALLVGVLLFVFSGPLVQAPLRDISSLIIIALSVLAVGAILTFSNSGPKGDNLAGAEYAQPILTAPDIERITPETYPHPVRTGASEEGSRIVTQISFGLILIVLVQYFIGRAIGATSFRNFWPYAPVIAMCLFAGSAVFFAVGTPLWKILAVFVVGIPSTPIVLHIIKTYRTRRGTRRGSIDRSAPTHQANVEAA
jgi:hypothetical protein